MGNGNFEVGSDTPHKTAKPIVAHKQDSGSSGASTVPANCGAMSQQGSFSYHGNVSSPQQLLHLVGCRDPRVRSEPWNRRASQQR